MSMEPGAACPKSEFGYWAGAARRWLKEGLPCRQHAPSTALDEDLGRGSVPFGFESALVSKSGTREARIRWVASQPKSPRYRAYAWSQAAESSGA